MSKLSCLLLASGLSLFSSLAFSAQDGLAVLLGNGQLVMGTQNDCEPYQADLQQSRKARVLSQDIAWVLADMAGRRLEIESSCEPMLNNNEQCRVIFSVGEGELAWARVYQFTNITSENDTPNLTSLRCFNLP